MKKIAKLLAVVLALCLMTACFSACGEEETKNVLVVGTNAEFPPFEYAEGENIVGLDIEMMQEVANRLGMTLKIENMKFDSLPEALATDKIDCIAAAMTVTPDREEQMDFTDGYYTANQTIIVKAGSAIKSADDLKNKKIGCQGGTTGQFLAEDLTKDMIAYNNGSLAVEALLSNQVDAVIIDNNPAGEYNEQYVGQLTLIENEFESETYAVAVKKGDTDLCNKINDAINAMKADGTFDAIVAKYIK